VDEFPLSEHISSDLDIIEIGFGVLGLGGGDHQSSNGFEDQESSEH